MQFPNVPQDIVKVPCLQLSLNEMHAQAPRKLYIYMGCICKVLLRKYFLDGRTFKLKKEINDFVQLDKKSFWNIFRG